MSKIGSYKNTAFSESQKFLVLDPSTSSASLVLASDLVAYITPKINSVRAESTRISAENTDYKVGEIIQTSGATTIGDGLATVYLVVAGGAGDFPMINGNDLLTIIGDDGLRADLISAVAGKGASIVSMQSGPTVENAIGQGVISWSGTRTYQIDSFANRAGVLYVCKTADHISATVPESDATNWRLIDAADVAYDNSSTELVAESTQSAIDEIILNNFKNQVTGTSTFTNATNNIQLTGIGSLFGLEIGDVIKVSNSVSNNTEFTVEVITDDNNVIVNQAHAGGLTIKSLVSETSTAGVNARLLVKWYSVGVGIGQGWVITGKTSGVTYTNLTGRSLALSVLGSIANTQSITLFVDGLVTGLDNQGSLNEQSSIFGIAPAGSTYNVTTSSGSIQIRELR
jgi:hypothetical protein